MHAQPFTPTLLRGPVPQSLCLSVRRCLSRPAAAVRTGSAAVEEPSISSAAQYVEVGQIGTAHGIRGELRVYLSTDNPESRFGKPGKRLLLQPQADASTLANLQDVLGQPGPSGFYEVTTESARPRADDVWLVKLKQVPDRTRAERLQGCKLLVEASARERIRSKDEFYVTDLVGCKVYHVRSGRLLGIVTDMFDGTGTHSTLLVQLKQNEADVLANKVRSCYIPFAKAICPVVKVAEKRVEIQPPVGLLELAAAKPVRRPLSPEQQQLRIKELAEQNESELQELKASGRWQPEEDSDEEEEDDEENEDAEEARRRDLEDEERHTGGRSSSSGSSSSSGAGAGAGSKQLAAAAEQRQADGAKPAAAGQVAAPAGAAAKRRLRLGPAASRAARRLSIQQRAKAAEGKAEETAEDQ